ncbi:MAG: hypothetical protein WCY11_02465 [Novosphingobium sp.]
MTLSLLSRIWPYLAGAALVIAAWAWADHRGYQRGKADCETRWQAAQEQAQADMARRESEWRAKADAATIALAEARAAAEHITERTTHEMRTYYRDRPAAAAVECLPVERVRAANDSRAAIHSGAAGG